MPAYDATTHHAKCNQCPLHTDYWRPVPNLVRFDPICQIVDTAPADAAVKFNEPGTGPLLEKLFRVLLEEGIPRDRVNYIYRQACKPHRGLTPQDKTLIKESCLPHLETAYDPKLPTLFLGNDSTTGILTQSEKARSNYCLEYGYKDMVTDYLGTVYVSKPGISPFFEDMVSRWTQNIKKKYTPIKWPKMVLEPNEEALEMLRNMGPDIGWDIETQGVDPLTVPITCIGVSDREKAVCVPWDAYDAKDWGHIGGLDSSIPLQKEIRAEMLRLLESDRRMFTQNGNYDVTGLLPRGVAVRNDVDIYNVHAVMFPAMKHNLEIIGLHCMNLPYRWKLAYKKGWRFDKTQPLNLEAPPIDKDHIQYEGGDPLFLRDYCAKDCFVTVESGLILLNRAEELSAVRL